MRAHPVGAADLEGAGYRSSESGYGLGTGANGEHIPSHPDSAGTAANGEEGPSVTARYNAELAGRPARNVGERDLLGYVRWCRAGRDRECHIGGTGDQIAEGKGRKDRIAAAGRSSDNATTTCREFGRSDTTNSKGARSRAPFQVVVQSIVHEGASAGAGHKARIRVGVACHKRVAQNAILHYGDPGAEIRGGKA